jgi:hypothetical protein
VDGLDQSLRRGGLEQEAAGSGLHRLVDVLVAVEGREHEDAPESKTPAYQVDCGGGTMDLYVIGATRLWDAEGNGYLIRSAEQSMEIGGAPYGSFTRSWGLGASSPGAITCTGGDFDLQGFWITHVELVIVPLP